MNNHPDIALIGCGKMGSAMLRGWLTGENYNSIHIAEPGGLPAEFAKMQKSGQVVHHDNAMDLPDCDIYILAVKPQIMEEVCKSLTMPQDALVLSIAAGTPIALFEKTFGTNQPVIRAMPNTPAAIGKGITVAVPNSHVSNRQRETADILLHAAGDVEWLEDENLLNAVTAVSGSGPAYIFHMIEAMAAGGEDAGLPPELAMKLARQTVIGAAALAEHDAEIPASTLRENVTSPGGTTEAALNILMRAPGGLRELVKKAIAAATSRGKELAS